MFRDSDEENQEEVASTKNGYQNLNVSNNNYKAPQTQNNSKSTYTAKELDEIFNSDDEEKAPAYNTSSKNLTKQQGK